MTDRRSFKYDLDASQCFIKFNSYVQFVINAVELQTYETTGLLSPINLLGTPFDLYSHPTVTFVIIDTFNCESTVSHHNTHDAV